LKDRNRLVLVDNTDDTWIDDPVAAHHCYLSKTSFCSCCNIFGKQQIQSHQYCTGRKSDGKVYYHMLVLLLLLRLVVSVLLVLFLSSICDVVCSFCSILFDCSCCN
jgi:hypothetical protein